MLGVELIPEGLGALFPPILSPQFIRHLSPGLLDDLFHRRLRRGKEQLIPIWIRISWRLGRCFRFDRRDLAARSREFRLESRNLRVLGVRIGRRRRIFWRVFLWRITDIYRIAIFRKTFKYGVWCFGVFRGHFPSPFELRHHLAVVHYQAATIVPGEPISRLSCPWSNRSSECHPCNRRTSG